MNMLMAWHDEADRFATWGTLDPPDGCVLGPSSPDGGA